MFTYSLIIHTWDVVCVCRRCACADDSATEPSLFVDKRSGGVRVRPTAQANRVVFVFLFVRLFASGETSRVHSVRSRRVDVLSKQIIKTFVFHCIFYTKQVLELSSVVYCYIRLNVNDTPRCCLQPLCTQSEVCALKSTFCL